MIKRSLHLRDIILLALIGIIFGVIYFAAGFVYNGLTVLLTPIGYGPMANDLTMGIWCMAGPLAGFCSGHQGLLSLVNFWEQLLKCFSAISGEQPT